MEKNESNNINKPFKESKRLSLKEELLRDDIKSKNKFKEELVNNDVLLSVNHLKQYFFFGKGPARQKLKAVHDINFQIKEGECFGLVGESGCGKTTTGRSIIRLYNITSGSIYYKGYRIAAGNRWNRKEIKYAKIRLNKKLKELREKLNKGEITPEKYKEECELSKTNAKNIVDAQKAKIAQIKYDDSHPNKKLMNEIQMIFQDPIDSLDPRMTVEDIIKEGLIISRNIQKNEIKKDRRHAIKEAKEKFALTDLSNNEVNALNDEIKKINEKYDAKLAKISRSKDHERVVEVLEKVGLIADYANRYPHEFSGGQRQRIGIARALIMNPKLLLCDEPISALDVSIRAQIINLLNNLKQEMGLTILFIAHDLSVVKYFCDRIAVMYFGEIVELADSDELFNHPLHPYTKSLLSAIPKPNPLTEKDRVRITYNPSKEHDYTEEKPKLVEIKKGHFILANSVEIEKYKAEILKLDELKKEKEEQEIIEKNDDSNVTNEEAIILNDGEVETLESNDTGLNETSEGISVNTEEIVVSETNESETSIETLNTQVEETNETEMNSETLKTPIEETSENEEKKEDLKDETPFLEETKSASNQINEEVSNEENKEKETKEKAPGDLKKVYHLKKVNGRWEIILKEGKKVIKTFDTKEEGLKYGQALAKSQNGTLLVHASKGKNKGKFQKS